MTTNPTSLIVGAGKFTGAGQAEFSHYEADGDTAIMIYNGSGEREAVATVCVTPFSRPAGPGKVWLKGWRENEGLPEALRDAGIVTLTETTGRVGAETAILAELTPLALHYIATTQSDEAREAQQAARDAYV